MAIAHIVAGVLQGEHAAWVLVERVEKLTDNKTSRCSAIATDSSSDPPRRLWRSVVIGPGALLSRALASLDFHGPKIA